MVQDLRFRVCIICNVLYISSASFYLEPSYSCSWRLWDNGSNMEISGQGTTRLKRVATARNIYVLGFRVGFSIMLLTVLSLVEIVTAYTPQDHHLGNYRYTSEADVADRPALCLCSPHYMTRRRKPLNVTQTKTV